MLLPSYDIPVPDESNTEDKLSKQPVVSDEQDESIESSSEEGHSDETSEVPRYEFPAKSVRKKPSRGRNLQ